MPINSIVHDYEKNEHTLLCVENLCIMLNSEDGACELLHNVSFTIHRGETLALVGESGSGKSLCAQAILGLLPHPALQISQGEVWFDGVRIDTLKNEGWKNIRGKRIAMIFQEPMAALNPVQTIGAQLAEVINLHFPERDIKTVYRRSVELLQQVGVSEPEQRLCSYPHQLSGGLCQRAMIAMALACEPDILIADEPSTALDVSTQQQLLQLLQTLQKQFRLAILFITHDLAIVAHWCTRVAVLQQGRLCEINNTEKIFTAPQHPYTKSLLAAICEKAPKATIHKSAPLLMQIKNICKSFQAPKRLLEKRLPARCVLNNISFDIFTGEILAIVGESGCGKSTLGRALLMLDPPDSGEIFYQNISLKKQNNKALQAFRRNVQIIFQDTTEALNPRHTIARILKEPLEIHNIGTATEREESVCNLLRIVEMPDNCGNRYPHEFSGGQRQRIGIARALALNPKTIVCDEAVSALDVSTQQQIIALLLELQKKFDLSLLFITHDLNIVRRIADRVLVMSNGKIAESNYTANIFENPQEKATKALLAATPSIPAAWQNPPATWP